MRHTTTTRRRGIARVLSATALALVATGCGIIDSDGEERQRELDSARSRWSAAGLSDYHYVVRQLCFCGFGGVRIDVVVRAGVVVGATMVDGGEVIDVQQQPWAAPSIDDLFDRIQGILDEDPHEFSASYDPVLGYPVEMSADPIENAIDEEWGVEASGVEALPPPT